MFTNIAATRNTASFPLPWTRLPTTNRFT